MLVELVELKALSEREEMFLPVVPLQRFGNGLDAALDTRVSHLSELKGIAFTIEDGTNDPHAGGSGDIADDFVQLDVHLGEGFLHVLDVGAGVEDESIPLPPVTAQHTDIVFRAKGAR